MINIIFSVHINTVFTFWLFYFILNLTCL